MCSRGSPQSHKTCVETVQFDLFSVSNDEHVRKGPQEFIHLGFLLQEYCKEEACYEEKASVNAVDSCKRRRRASCQLVAQAEREEGETQIGPKLPHWNSSGKGKQ